MVSDVPVFGHLKTINFPLWSNRKLVVSVSQYLGTLGEVCVKYNLPVEGLKCELGFITHNLLNL